MATNYITKSFNKNSFSTADSGQLAQRFETMMNNVMQMIEKEGPIYHTWIAFQVGGFDDPVLFNTDTTDPNQNCIASLSIDKNGAGVANSFTLNIIFDLFKYGQNSDIKGSINKLDDFLAQAMSYNIEKGETGLLGYIQYGYVSTSTDLDLSSPFYSYYITDATSDIDTASGIAQYTFKGVTTLSADCNINVNISSYPADWKLLDVVEWTIFYNYGDNEHKPAHTTGDCADNDYKYRIDIPEDLYNANKELTVGYVNNGKPLDSTKQNPIQYVQELLGKFPLTKEEMDSGIWDDWEKLNYNQRPRYDWYITDHDGLKTWHLTHYCPGDSNGTDNDITMKSNTKNDDLNYELGMDITWGLQQKNIVLNWKPEIDLKSYLLRKATYLRAKRDFEAGGIDNLQALQDNDAYDDIKNAINDGVFRQEESIIQEYYNAEITFVGIPAEPPIDLRMRIIPRILETYSRTQGTYLVKSSSDTITNTGLYTTTCKLMRIDDKDGTYAALQKQIQEQEKQKQNVSSNNNSNKIPTTSATSQNIPKVESDTNKGFTRPTTTQSPWENLPIKLKQ